MFSSKQSFYLIKEETSKMRKKRFLAVVMAASMVFGNSVAALAADDTVPPAEGELTGKIALEGIVDPDVFRVELPVESAGDVKTAFDFIMDPQNLIEQTSGARYVSGQGVNNLSTNKFDYGTLYFANTSSNGDVLKLSPSSNELKITNKGTMDVDVKLTAEVVSLNGVKLVSTNSISDGDAPSVYLALSGNGVQKPITEGGIDMEATISGNDDAYSISWNADEKKYEKVASENAAFVSFNFLLTGASGGSVKDWLEIEDDLTNAEVNVTWVVTPEGYSSSPFAKTTLKMVQGQLAETAVTMPNGATAINSIKFARESGEEATLADTNYVLVDGKLRFRATFIDSLISAGVQSRTFTVIFNDSNKTEAKITLER